MISTTFKTAPIWGFILLIAYLNIDAIALASSVADLGKDVLWYGCAAGVVALLLAAVGIYAWRQSTADEREADQAEVQLQTAQARREIVEIEARSGPEYIAATLQAELMELQLGLMRQAAELEYSRLAAQAAINQAITGASTIKDVFGGTLDQVKRNTLVSAVADPLALPEGRLTTLAEDLATFKTQDAPQIRVISGMGGGKSTLLHGVTSATTASVLLVQTHERVYEEDYAGYGDRVKVIGMLPATGDPNTMDTANATACDHIVRMRDVIKSRYANNTRSPCLLILDEWVDICLWAVQYGREDAINALREMSTSKARKAGVGIVLASQTDRATVSGFKGLADILKQMTEVRLYKDGGDRWATVAHFGGALVEYEAAPRHHIVMKQEYRKDAESASMPYISIADELAAAERYANSDAVPEAFNLAFRDSVDDIELTAEHSRAMDVYQNVIEAPGTISRRQATQAAFGEGKFGQTYLDKLFRLWEGLNLDVSTPEFK